MNDKGYYPTCAAQNYYNEHATNYAHASLIPGVNMSSVIRSRSGFLYLSRARDAALGDIYGMVHRQACHVPSIGNAEHSNLQVNESCEKGRDS